MKHYLCVLCALFPVAMMTAYCGKPTLGEEAPVEDAYFVSVAGSDENDGSEAAPWRTIQHAVDSAVAGDTIYVLEGEYAESVYFKVSGSEEEGYITLRNYPGHRPVVSGAPKSTKMDMALMYINGKHHIKIEGFELGPFVRSRGFPAAIWVVGSAHHIEIRDNYVHHVENDESAHGIAVYGTSVDPAHDIVIDGNEVAYCKLGSSESVVVNGNVEHFVVSNNVIHDNNNIGIDIIGHEGKCPDEELDRARDGVVVGNLVYNIDSRGNPAYGDERSADGIYVDGGTRILIERNVVHDCNIGIELASEWHGKDTSYVTARNNFVYNSHTTGIAIGGYDRRRGSTHHCTIVNNTLYNNDTDRAGSGEILIQFDTHDNVVKNNILYANSQNLFISNDYAENVDNVVDYNLYYGPGEAEWGWQGKYYSGFGDWQDATGNDAHSLFVDPLLVDVPSGDLHIGDGSPAIDAGEALPGDVIGTEDIDGEERVRGRGIDVGADER
jgi:hypothetical protein